MFKIYNYFIENVICKYEPTTSTYLGTEISVFLLVVSIILLYKLLKMNCKNCFSLFICLYFKSVHLYEFKQVVEAKYWGGHSHSPYICVLEANNAIQGQCATFNISFIIHRSQLFGISQSQVCWPREMLASLCKMTKEAIQYSKGFSI